MVEGGGAIYSSQSGIVATGGIVSDYTEGSTVYRAHVFTHRTFSVTALGTEPAEVDYLLVAGGGAGGSGSYRLCGGGGAGGLLNHPDVPASSPTGATRQAAYSVSPGSYTVSVGAGGAGATDGTIVDGSASNFYPTPVSHPHPTYIRALRWWRRWRKPKSRMQMVQLEHQETLVDLAEEDPEGWQRFIFNWCSWQWHQRVKVLLVVKQLVHPRVRLAAVAVPVEQVATMLMDLSLPIHQEHTIRVVMVVMVCKSVIAGSPLSDQPMGYPGPGATSRWVVLLLVVGMVQGQQPNTNGSTTRYWCAKVVVDTGLLLPGEVQSSCIKMV